MGVARQRFGLSRSGLTQVIVIAQLTDASRRQSRFCSDQAAFAPFA